jgi:hypothetical protein
MQRMTTTSKDVCVHLENGLIDAYMKARENA